MAEKAVKKKAIKSGAPKETKEETKATPRALAKPETQKLAKQEVQKAVVAAAKAPSEVAVKAPAEVTVKALAEVQAQAPKTDEAKAEAKAGAKKESDPNKEFVDGIMAEMSLKGASKKRLIRKLAEQYNFDKQRVLFKLKRALITERYAAAHAEAGH